MRLKDKQTGEIDEYLFSDKRGGTNSVGLNKDGDINDPIFFNSLAELCERFEDAPEEKKYDGRVPKVGDKYWAVESFAQITENTWTDNFPNQDSFEYGFAFWTREEAEKELARRKAYVILKEDTKGFKPDWDDSYEPKHGVYYDHINSKFYLLLFGTNQYGADLFFATEEDARASIKVHRQQWVDYFQLEEAE